jgi:beta-galactosidase
MLAIFALASLTAVVPSTEFNSRSFILDGKPTLLLSGAVHYERVLPADWNRTFALMAEMGLNTVQTYVMWNFHEHKRGNATFEGRADIVRFVRTAQAHGLYAVVRIGPYICGEYMFGGYPLWLRDSGAKCFRCSDPVYMRESIAWVERLVNELVAKRALQPQGGNVLMLQIENEWNGEGSEVTDYLQATVDAARNITTLVPWILCHDVDQCTEINAAPGAPTDGKGRAICTINGFWEEERTVDPHQPSVAWLDALRAGNPQQPAMWTEDQGWFDQWGVAQRVRYSSDQAYGIMRAFANGLSYHNFYMVTGGSNFGLQVSVLLCTVTFHANLAHSLTRSP